LRTLDAIHLAASRGISSDLGVMFVYDVRLKSIKPFDNATVLIESVFTLPDGLGDEKGGQSANHNAKLPALGPAVVVSGMVFEPYSTRLHVKKLRGGGGNRTRVLQLRSWPSPSAADR
jgi:hypothetical protein